MKILVMELNGDIWGLHTVETEEDVEFIKSQYDESYTAILGDFQEIRRDICK